jgi:hypothetical protein
MTVQKKERKGGRTKGREEEGNAGQLFYLF